MNAPKIVVVGSTNVDFVMRVKQLPRPGETVTEGEFIQTYGGKGANQAVAAARAGGNVTFITAVGDDHYGKAMLENLVADGICIDHVIRDFDHSSGSALIMTDAQGENYISVAPGANYSLTSAGVESLSNVISQANLLILQMEIPLTTVVRALELAHSAGVTTMLNYAPVRDACLPIRDLIDVLIVNESEASALTGLEIDSLEHAQMAADLLYRLGPRVVVVTLGKVGSQVKTASISTHIPAVPVTAVDSTAAGDTFCGALAVALVEKREIVEAVRFASAASALTVQRLGAQPSIPTRAEIDRFLSAFDSKQKNL